MAIARQPISDFIGDHLSVSMFGAVRDGRTDDSAALQAAVDAIVAAGGGDLYLPGGRTMAIASPITIASAASAPVPVRIHGDGASSVLLRSGVLADGYGLLNIGAGVEVSLLAFAVEGAVPTAEVLDFAAIANPMHATLTRNTSIWVHGGSSKVLIQGVTVRHTGGYAVLLDATAGDVDNVQVLDSLFENNRPHFGTSGGVSGGHWTGGIHYQGDGERYAVSNLVVRGNTFRRMGGNCVWGHLYDFDRLHSNIQVTDNRFTDIALDGILTGGVSGGSVARNTFRRVGYLTQTDTDSTVPRYVPGHYACALDTSGLVRGVNYSGNSMISVNGGCIDLDGYSEGVVSGNVCRIPLVGEPEYSEDSIGEIGPGGVGANWVYGAQTSNSNNIDGPGRNVSITGNTFANLGGGAVRLYAARHSSVYANNIQHPTDAHVVPVVLGNIGTGDFQRAHDNVVSKNTIHWEAAGYAAIREDAQYGAFSGTDANWVAGNEVSGGAFEFEKDETTQSSTRLVLSAAQAGLTAASESRLVREGAGDASVLRFYKNRGGTLASVASLFDVLTISTGGTGGPLLNVSAGAGAGGAISTGGRTTLAFDDTVATGKLYGDGFLAMGDATYSDAEANRLGAGYALIRVVGGEWQQSVAASGGARVWEVLGGPRVSSLTGTAAQISVSAANGAVTVALANQITVVGAVGGAGLTLTSGWFAANDAINGGYYAAGIQSDVFNAPNGGITVGLGVTMGQALYAKSLAANPNTPGVGYGALGHRSGSVWFYYNPLTAAWATVDLAQLGDGVSSLTGTANQVIVSASTGAVTLSLPQSIAAASSPTFSNLYVSNCVQALATGASIAIQVNGGTFQVSGAGDVSAAGQVNAVAGYKVSGTSAIDAARNATFVTATISGAAGSAVLVVTAGYVSAEGGYATTSTAVNAIKAPAGGATAKWLVATESLTLTATAAPGASGTGQARVYCGVDGKLYVSENGGAYQALVSTAVAGVTSLAGTANQVIVSASTGAVTLSLPQAIATTSSVTFGSVTTSGVVQSTGTGSAITFQNSSGSFQVDGNGNVSGGGSANLTGGYKVAGTAVIDGSRYASFAKITASDTGLFCQVRAPFPSLVTGVGNGAAIYLGIAATSSTTPTGAIEASWGGGGTPQVGIGVIRDGIGASILMDYFGVTFIRSSLNTIAYFNTSGLTVVGSAGTAGIALTNGYMSAGGGFLTTSTNYDSIQTAGGLKCGQLTLVAKANPGLSTAGTAVIYMNSSSGGVFLSANGGAYVQLGGAATGVTALYAGTGMSVNANTGGVTVTNAGVTSLTAGTNITLSATTGGITISASGGSTTYTGGTGVTVSGTTISIGQAVSTSSAVTFYSLTTSDGLQINKSSGYGLYLPYTYAYANGFNSFSGSWNGIQSSGGVAANLGFYLTGGTQVVNSSGAFIGPGVAVGAYGVGCGAVNIWGGSSYYPGRTATLYDRDGNVMVFRGGVLSQY